MVYCSQTVVNLQSKLKVAIQMITLPLNKKFPQENKQYFATKRYVRKDKYELDHLVPKEMKLPPLSSIYKM